MLDAILDEVTYHYLESGDFNGITVASLADRLSVDVAALRSGLVELIKTGSVNVRIGRDSERPYILQTSFESVENQVAALPTSDIDRTCVYPSAGVLRGFVVEACYAGSPYSLALALGEPQYNYRSFDLRILEIYRNDPRFYYVNDDVSGLICLTGIDTCGEGGADADEAFLPSFGFSYDGSMNRGVAVFLKYLSFLNPEHQSIWFKNELPDTFEIYPDYYRISVLGEPGTRVPILKALLLEIFMINQMSAAMSRPKLFNIDFGPDLNSMPIRFSYSVRPTRNELGKFISLLVELLLDNLDAKFFEGEVIFDQGRRRSLGVSVIERKGSLQTLDAWVRTYFHPHDWSKWDEAIGTLWYLRNLRQPLPEADSDSRFDQKYFKHQRELAIRAFKAVRTLRLLLANHPDVREADIPIPKWLSGGRIWA